MEIEKAITQLREVVDAVIKSQNDLIKAAGLMAAEIATMKENKVATGGVNNEKPKSEFEMWQGHDITRDSLGNYNNSTAQLQWSAWNACNDLWLRKLSVERIARTICRAGICGPKSHLDEQENRNWRRFETEARAIIAMLKEEKEN